MGYSSGSLPPIPAQPLTGGDGRCSREHSRGRHAEQPHEAGKTRPGQPRGLFSTKLHRDRRKGRSNSRLGRHPRGWHSRGPRQEPAQEGNWEFQANLSAAHQGEVIGWLQPGGTVSRRSAIWHLQPLARCLKASVASAFQGLRPRPKRQQVFTTSRSDTCPSSTLTRVSREPFPQGISYTVRLGKRQFYSVPRAGS